MSDAAVTRSSTPARQPARTPQRAQPPADDVRAMSEAFARARGGEARQGAGQLPGQLAREPMSQRLPLDRKAMAMLRAAPDARAQLAEAAGLCAADERGALDRRDGERSADQGFALFSPAGGVQPVAVVAQPPAPHVDPAAFAQAMADLWTRENGRGDKQVRVRFGADAWPATGALMVKTADGLLDVTVDVAPGGPVLPTAALGQALGEAGLVVGRVEAREAAA